jgi:uncharacterized protein YajQ (UPF0234 family)
MARKKSALDNLSQTHGKVENRKVTLDQIWGDDGRSKYGTLDPIEYDSYLKGLVKTDLQAHAVKIGLIPVDDRQTLVKRLKQEFLKYSAQYQVRPDSKNVKPVSKTVRDILSEGR